MVRIGAPDIGATAFHGEGAVVVAIVIEKRVEAVRRALYLTADKSADGGATEKLGNGVLRAADALLTPAAEASGDIISSGWGGGYGNRIVIDHGLVRGVELATTYNHLTRIVASGHVARGQLIAYSGTTGLSTGCHLHFETLVNGSYVNPLGWV